MHQSNKEKTNEDVVEDAEGGGLGRAAGAGPPAASGSRPDPRVGQPGRSPTLETADRILTHIDQHDPDARHASDPPRPPNEPNGLATRQNHPDEEHTDDRT